MEIKPLARETRRFHRKSRNGCMQCKQRHVKCDENKPSCGNCLQTSRMCSFLRMMPSIPTTLATANTSGSSNSSSSNNNNNISSPVIYSGPPTPTSASSATTIAGPCSIDAKLFRQYPQTPEFSLADLSMLQNFTTHTSRSLTFSPDVQHVWATTVVQIALQHRFLLHGLLALSALHTAYTGNKSEDNRQLVDYAARHQAIGLSLYQHALASPTPGQREALFILSVLIFLLAIATLREDSTSDTGSGSGNRLDSKWIRLARGILVVNDSDHMDEIGRGPLSVLMQKEVRLHPEQREDTPLPYDLQNLQRLWRSGDMSLSSHGSVTGMGMEYNLTIPEVDRQAYEEAYSALLLTYSQVAEQIQLIRSEAVESKLDHPQNPTTFDPYHNERVRTEIFLWVIRIPEHYIELLDQHDSIALIILAHYAAMLSRDRRAWWAGQSAHAIITSVWTFLDESLKKWIESPMADIRRADG